MSHMRLLVAAAILALVIIVSFVVSVPRAREVNNPTATTIVTTTAPAVTLRDTYKKGVHTITGTVQMPDACGQVKATASLAQAASSTPAIQVAITTTSTSDDVCLQVPTAINYSTTVTATAKAQISVTINGVAVTPNTP